MDELVKRIETASEDIQGEFTPDISVLIGQSSGFYCRKCELPLLIGAKRCSRCSLEFVRNTPPVEFVEKYIRPELRRYYYTQRTTEEELERSRENRKKRL